MITATKEKQQGADTVPFRSAVTGRPGAWRITLPSNPEERHSWDVGRGYDMAVDGGRLVLARSQLEPFESRVVQNQARSSTFLAIPASHIKALGWNHGTTLYLQIQPERIEIYRPFGQDFLRSNLFDSWLAIHAARGLTPTSVEDYLSEAIHSPVAYMRWFRWSTGRTTMPNNLVNVLLKDVLTTVAEGGTIKPTEIDRLVRGISMPVHIQNAK